MMNPRDRMRGMGRLEGSLLFVQLMASVEGPGLGLRDARCLLAAGHAGGVDTRPRGGGVVPHGRESLMKIESAGPVWGAWIFPDSARRATMSGVLTQVDVTGTAPPGMPRAGFS